ncbi:MAG: metallophosphoesterase [Thermodesulfobacteriota bacterium]|jgi:3',5'-cyclic AMP phosphodiesterase CpdA
MKITIIVAVLLTIFLIAEAAGAIASEHESRAIPSYAGFEEIQDAKNRLIIVGDTQSTSHWEFWRERNDKERKLIIDEITKREPAFVIHLGDLTTRGSSDKHWQEFDDMHKDFREKKIPYFPTLGNHELYGNDEKALQNYFERFPYLDKKRWYSFTWKNVAMVMVDSNFSTLTKEQIERQSQWYLDELEKFERNKEVAFIIVCCHEPPFTNSRVVGPNEKVKVYFADPFLRFRKTRLFFSGHSHSYERFQIGDKFFIVSGGGGGPRHKVMIDPRKRRYQDLFSGPELRFFHFCEIENRDDTLIFRVLRLESDGSFAIIDPLLIGP